MGIAWVEQITSSACSESSRYPSECSAISSSRGLYSITYLFKQQLLPYDLHSLPRC